MEQVNDFPAGWDERRVRDTLEHYENQTDEEAAAEHEAALPSSEHKEIKRLSQHRRLR